MLKLYVYDFNEYTGHLYLTSADYEKEIMVGVDDLYDPGTETWDDEAVKSRATETARARFGQHTVIAWDEPLNSGEREEKEMKHYIVYLTEASGATTAIDQIVTEDGYTAEQYIADCDDNADPEWCEMLHNGEVTLEAVED